MSPKKPWWPAYVSSNEIVVIMERLNYLQFYTTVPEACRVIGVGREPLMRWLWVTGINPILPHTAAGIRRHLKKGEMIVHTRTALYYDPRDLRNCLQRVLEGRGAYEQKLIENFPPRPVPWRGPRPVTPNPSNRFRGEGAPLEYKRWTEQDLLDRIAAAAPLLQWLQPREVVPWLGVTKGTLHRWRKRDIGPPFLQQEGLVPSFAQGFHTLRKPQRTFNYYYNPVLYDRNQVVLWLRDLLSRK